MTDEPTQAEEPVQNAVQSEQVSEPSKDIKEDDAPAEEGSDAKADKPKEPDEIERVKQSSQKRINQMRAKMGEYERRMQELDAIVADFKKQQGPKAPNENDFETVEEYHKALGRFEAEQEIAEKQSKEQAEKKDRANRERQEKAQKIFDERVSKFKSENPDFDDAAGETFLILESDNSATSKTLASAFLELENGHALLYHLGKNPDQLEEILSKPPVSAIYELAKIELSDAPKRKAPLDPVRPIKPRSSGNQPETALSGRELRKKYGML